MKRCSRWGLEWTSNFTPHFRMHFVNNPCRDQGKIKYAKEVPGHNSAQLGRHKTLQWRHNGHDSVLNHQTYDCLLNRLFRRRSRKPSKLRVPGLCAGNSPGTGEFPAQMASNAENVSIWWRHQELHLHNNQNINHVNILMNRQISRSLEVTRNICCGDFSHISTRYRILTSDLAA